MTNPPPPKTPPPSPRILPELATGTPKRAPGGFSFDTRNGTFSLEHDPDHRRRPLGRLIPKAGNTSRRAARRVMGKGARL